MIHRLYPIPVYHQKNVFKITPEQLLIIDQLPMQQNDDGQLNWMSFDFNILEIDLLKNIKNVVLDHINIFKNDICGISFQDFCITDSWIAKTIPGGQHLIHNHPNAIISGVLYIKTPKDTSLNFFNSTNLFNNFQFQFDYNKETDFNRTNWVINVEEGDMVIFPSWLQHYVPICHEERLVIGFNCFVTGTFKNNRYPTNLTIQQNS